MEEVYEIKSIKRNRKTGDEIVNVSSEYMARAIYGNEIINVVIANKKTNGTLLEIKK